MRIAFCKFAGLANGGTEKYLQTLAMLYLERGAVDFYYTNAAPILHTSWIHPDNSVDRIDLLERAGVNLIPVNVRCRDGGRWIDSNFFELFQEDRYDVLITAGNGSPEFPYTDLGNVTILHTVHGTCVFNKSNVRSVLLCEWQAKEWLKNGGDVAKLTIIPGIIPVPKVWSRTIRSEYNIPEDALVYGLHQASGVASLVSLQAFAIIQDVNSYYIILGGDILHRRFVADAGIKNVIF